MARKIRSNLTEVEKKNLEEAGTLDFKSAGAKKGSKEKPSK